MFDYQLIQSPQRKTITITVRDGEVFIRAPKRLSIKTVQDFIVQHSPWVEKKLFQYQSQTSSNINQLSDGGKVMYGGKIFLLRSTNQKSRIDESAQTTFLRSQCFSNPQATFLELQSLYKKLLLEYIGKKLPECIQLLNLEDKQKLISFKIRSYKRKWGSCQKRITGSFGNPKTMWTLTFDWKLLSFETMICDYLIFHELSHIIHPNHSKSYHDFLENHFDDLYHNGAKKQAERFLKEKSLEFVPLQQT